MFSARIEPAEEARKAKHFPSLSTICFSLSPPPTSLPISISTELRNGARGTLGHTLNASFRSIFVQSLFLSNKINCFLWSFLVPDGGSVI